MNNLPSGTVTFLFTDIEGSTKRWEAYPQQMRSALQAHDTILRSGIEEQGGYVFKTVGDAFCAAFPTPHDALSAALHTQHSLHQEKWPAEIGQVKVRMALHTGVTEEREGDYFGPPVNRVARLLSAGHGGQILLFDPAYDLVRDAVPTGVELRSLGEHRLKDLQRPETIYQVVTADLPSEFPPLKTLDRHPHNLPVQLTPLIGREKELASLYRLLLRDEVRLVTLTGAGGTGKTRLALQAAAEAIEEFQDGAFFINLAPITNPDLVVSEIAQTLGVRESAGRPLLDTLKEYLHDKQMLLLLDNFEQVAEAAPVVTALLTAAPRLKVLVTSRTVLHVYGEHDFSVPPLSLPDLKHLPPSERLTQYEAVRLFIERAQAARADFQITNYNAPAVAEICHRLDGLPLAIELAAARIKILPPQAMLARLQSRLKLLTGGGRDLPTRQQTLRGAIEWSFDLLEDGEKQLLRRLAVFVGGHSLEAIEAVCNAEDDLGIDVLDGVSALVDKSLLRQEEGAGGEPRFTMLETIHEYASEKLQESGEAERVQQHHAEYFLWFAQTAEMHLRGMEQAIWMERLEEDHDNLRAALGWTHESSRVEMELLLAGALAWSWELRGYLAEGREWLRAVLSRANQGHAGEQSAGMARALSAAGRLAYRYNDLAAAHAYLQESLQIARDVGDKRAMMLSLHNLGNIAVSAGDYEKARIYHEEELAIATELDDGWSMAWALMGLGRSAMAKGDYSRARTLFEEALAIRKASRDKWGIARSLRELGEVARRQGNHIMARSLFEESLAIHRQLGQKGFFNFVLPLIGQVAYRQGDYARAAEALKESLTLFREEGHYLGIMSCLVALAQVAKGQGETDRAARLFGAADAQGKAYGVDLGGIEFVLEEQSEHDNIMRVALAPLNEEVWRKAWEDGRAMSMEQVIAYALEEPDDG